MTRSVADAALLLTVMAGRDSADAATTAADERKTDYAASLSSTSLKGKRLGYFAAMPDCGAGLKRTKSSRKLSACIAGAGRRHRRDSREGEASCRNDQALNCWSWKYDCKADLKRLSRRPAA